MTILYVLGLSIVLQFLAAVLAFRLIWVTGRQLAWLLLSAAIFLMAVRRSISLYFLAPQGVVQMRDLSSELVGLVVSILMVIGIGLIGRIFRNVQQTNDQFKKEKSERKLAEKELKLAHERYRHISSIASDISYSCCKSTATAYSIDWIVGASEHITGYSEDEIKALGCWRTLVIDQDLPAFDKHVIGVAPDTTDSCQLRLRHKNGQTLWVNSFTKCVLDLDFHDVLRLYGGFVDITDRKKTEDALRQSEEKFAKVFHYAPVLITLSNVDDGTYLDVNDKFSGVSGFSRAESVGKTSVELGWISKEDRISMIEELQAHGSVREMDLKLLTKDKREIHCIYNGELIQANDRRLLLSIALDITERKKIEAALRESEERYRIVADFTHDWEYWVDAEGNFLYVSPSCERITGYSAKEFIDDPDLMNRIIHPDDFIVMLDHFYKVRKAAPQAVDAMDFRIVRCDGATRWIGHVCQPVYGQEGQILGRRGSNRDITERKQSEDQIKLNESRLQSLYEISQYRAKNVQELLDFALEHAIRLTGSQVGYIYHYDENNRRFILNTWSKEVMKQCEVAEPQNVYELDKTGIWGEAVRQQTAIIVNDFQAPNPLKKGYPPGHVELFKFMTAPIFQEDKIVAVVGVANKKSNYDVSDVRQLSLLVDSVWRMIGIQRALEQEKLLSTVIENTAEGIIVTDREGVIQYVNPSQETLSGYSRDELIGQTLNIFKSENYDENFYRTLWDTINSGKVWSGRFINKKKDGTEYHEDASISPVYDKSGNLTNFVAVKHDVTNQLTLQDQLFQAQKMEAIGTLAGGFAHDFRNVLQVVMGFLDLIQMNKDLPEKLQTNLDKIRNATESGAELVKGMLVFSRKTSVKLEPLNLGKLVEHVESLLVRTIPKMIQIDLVQAHDLSMINADTTQLEQILMNLAINAADAMPDGGRLTIKTNNIVLDDVFCRSYPNTKPGRYVVVTVSDTGTGMDEETVKRIFEPFFTTKEKGKGTGLGLAVVYGIVEQHGAIIKCDSQPLVGTTFRIYFPAIEKVFEEEYFEKKEPPSGQGETILMVDDEPYFLETTSRLLMDANYRVITVSNGKEALEVYEKRREEIRLVILDLIMPEMGGKQCLESLRNKDPYVRVLIATGHTHRGMTQELKEAGASGFILKPFNMPQLLEKIRKIIDEH